MPEWRTRQPNSRREECGNSLGDPIAQGIRPASLGSNEGGQTDLAPHLLEYLRDVAEQPFSPATERDERVGASRYRGVHARRRLADLGLVRPHRVSTGRRAGQIVLLELTRAGEERLRAAGLDVHRDREEPFQRGYYLHQLTAYVARTWPAARIDRAATSSLRFPDLVAVFEQHPSMQSRVVALAVLMDCQVEGLTRRLDDFARFDHVYICTETAATAKTVLDTLRRALPEERVESFTVGPVTAFLPEPLPASTLRRGHAGSASHGRHRRRPPSPLIRDALEAYQHLHDLDWLQGSPLIELDSVRERANPLSPMPEAQALRGLLIDAAKRASKHARDVPSLAAAQLFLERYIEGKRVSEIAEELGVSREWCSKAYRKQALELAGMQFVRLASRADT